MRDYPDTIIHLPQTFDTDVFAPSSTATFVLELGPETQRVLANIEHQMARIADGAGMQAGHEQSFSNNTRKEVSACSSRRIMPAVDVTADPDGKEDSHSRTFDT